MSSSPNETENWVVCPVCHQANPAGTKFCKVCWGAGLEGEELVPTKDLERVLQWHRSRDRRRRNLIRLAIWGGVSVVVLAIAWFFFRNYTDVLSPISANLSSDSPPGQWSMFRHDLLNTGASGNNAVLPTGTLKWSFATGDAVQGSAVVVAGTVYFGSRNGKVYALDAQTGVEKWHFTTENRVDSSPAVVDGRVYIGSNDGHLYSLDAMTGKQLWQVNTFYPVTSSPSVVNGVVYFGADDYCVYAVDARTGAKIWKYNTGGPVQASPVVANGLVYAPCGGQYIFVLNASNGRPRLRFRTSDSTYASAAVMGETALIGNFRGEVYVFNGHARNWPLEYELKPYWIQVWAFGLAPAPPLESGWLWGYRVGSTISATPAIKDDVAFVGTDGNLVALDLESRTTLWKFASGGDIGSSPAVAGDVVYFGCQDGKVYAVNKNDGTKLWDFSTGGQVNSSPTLVDGVLYVGSYDGSLYAIK